MTDLESRLADLGEHIAVDDENLARDVLAQLRPSRDRTPWLRAAVLLALVVGSVMALPDARRAVAEWFGFGAVTIVRLPDDAIERADNSFELAGPGNSTIDIVDGREVLISRFDATLSAPLLTKSVGASTSVIAIEVLGRPGVWIGDGPHEILYETNDGIGVARSAGQTLLWQADDVVVRLEGFPDLESALEHAATIDPSSD